MQKTIFVVDDVGTNLSVAEEALESQYRVITLSSAAKMFAILERLVPDLILLDIKMPEMDGFEAMKRLRANEKYADIPVIFLTGLSDSANEAYGIELGAVDFITKPFSEPVLLNRIRNHLHIDELIHERTKQLAQLQNSIVFTLADLVESRDLNTGGHIERTTTYLKILMDAMVERKVYEEEMKSWDVDAMVSSSRLHDIGKISIPDSILNKPGPLTPDEFSTMKTHTSIGEKIVDHMAEQTGNINFLTYAKLFAAYHHEWWNGTGYPYGLKETEIPLTGRILAFVDVYDALTSERPYKKPFPHQVAVDIIVEETGRHFDPSIANVFFEVQDQFDVARKELDKM